MPMTEPEVKATLRPEFRDVLAAQAVLAFDPVATYMPINPARAEKNPPVIKAKGRKGERK